MGAWHPSVLPFSLLEHAALVFAGLLTYVLATRMGRQRRHPSAAVGWVLAIVLMPYAGLPLFLVFGTRKFARAPRAARPSPIPDEAGTASWAVRLAAAMDLGVPVGQLAVRFDDDGGEALVDQLQGIAAARRSVELCTYVLGDDEVGRTVADALIASASRGVKVRLMLDAIGSLRTPSATFDALRAAGVELRRFMPLLHNPLRGRTNLRNHRKLLVVDGARVWSGGRNQAIEYFLPGRDGPAWRDLSFRIDGPLAVQAQHVFEHDWSLASGLRLRERLEFHGRQQARERTKARLSQAAPARAADFVTAADSVRSSEPEAPAGACAQLIPSGPDHADDTMYALLLAGAYHARTRIVAVTPYFVPDEALLIAWSLACRRGVALTLVLPRRSNHRLADLARERSLRALADAGAAVLLHPEMVHAKAVIIDDAVAFCGSINLDSRSLFLNYELNTAFYGAAQIRWLADWSGRLAHEASPYRVQTPSWTRDVVEGVVRSIGFQL